MEPILKAWPGLFVDVCDGTDPELSVAVGTVHVAMADVAPDAA